MNGRMILPQGRPQLGKLKRVNLGTMWGLLRIILLVADALICRRGDQMKAACSWCTLCLVAICCVASSNARAETWLCDMQMGEKTYKQEWRISGDRMWAPKGKAFFHVLKNDEHILLASVTAPGGSKDKNSHFTSYVVIEKAAGTVLDIDDIVISVMVNDPVVSVEDLTPNVDVGHCVVDPRPTPPPPVMPPLRSIGSTTGPTGNQTPQPPTAVPLSLVPPNPGPERPTVGNLLERQKAEKTQKADRTVDMYKPLVECVKRRAHSSELFSSAESADVAARAAVGFCSKEEANYRAALRDLGLVMTNFNVEAHARDDHEELVDMALTIIVGERQHIRQ
jgi:hypothetical protein